jgi:hypothetical protein
VNPRNESPSDDNYTTAVIMKAVGGEIGSASALAPKLGPLGLVRFKSKDDRLFINRTITATFPFS